MVGILCPPPRLLTLIVESERFSSESVPTWVGCSRVGGGRFVNFGSQRIELAVVSFFAMVKGEGAGKVDARFGDGRAFEEEGDAVVRILDR